MGLFDFFRKNKRVDQPVSPTDGKEDMSYWTGKDFEFLIKGDIELSAEQFDILMLPNSFNATRKERDGWIYFQVNGDEFTYSWEPPGIQMTFNKEVTFQKAKKIADEVIEKLNAAGFNAELMIIGNSRL